MNNFGSNAFLFKTSSYSHDFWLMLQIHVNSCDDFRVILAKGCGSHFPLLVRQLIRYIVYTEKKNNIANLFEFILDYHPTNTNVTINLTDNTILVNKTFSITCSAQANPPAKYRFYKGNEYINGADNNAVITTSVSERVKMVNYSCIPFNFYGNGTKKATAVTVHCKYFIVWIP